MSTKKLETRGAKDFSRLIGKEDLCSYLGLGRVGSERFARDAGAERRIGRRCLYDVKVLDAAIDKLGAN